MEAQNPSHLGLQGIPRTILLLDLDIYIGQFNL